MMLIVINIPKYISMDKTPLLNWSKQLSFSFFCFSRSSLSQSAISQLPQPFAFNFLPLALDISFLLGINIIL